LVFAGTAEIPRPGTVEVELVPARGRLVSTGLARSFEPTRALVAADGRFDIGDLLPGGYRLKVAIKDPIGAESWSVASVVSDGVDVTDDGVNLEADRSPTVHVRLTDRPSMLRGTLTLPSGEPVTEYFVVAFTIDRDLWGRRSRRIAAVLPTTDGAFRFETLLPGEYYLAALADVTPDEWYASSFLSQLVQWSVRVVVAEGESVVQDLQIIK
jgi:hypothetical protein